MLCVLPIRSFATGMVRLREVLDDSTRAQLSRVLADHVLTVARSLTEAIVVTADPEVMAWCADRGVTTVAEPGAGLNAAAAAGIDAAGGRRWAVLHADLPYLSEADLRVAFAVGAGTVLAPTHDGGTSLIVGEGDRFPFCYGVSSFHRHLRAMPDARVIVRTGLALDLDTPGDLDRFRGRHPEWAGTEPTLS